LCIRVAIARKSALLTLVFDVKDLDNLPKLYITGTIAPSQGIMDMFSGEPTVSSADVRKFLDEHKDDPEIVVEISSDGGYKTQGIEIFKLLRNSGKVVHTVTYKACSIATVVMLGNANGGKRLIDEYAPFLIHLARLKPQDLGDNFLTASDLEELAEEIKQADTEILDLYCEELGEDKRTQLMGYMMDEVNLGAKGAIRLGFANGYYKKKKKEKPVTDFKNIFITDSLGEKIQNNMEKTLEQKVNGFEETLNKIKKSLVMLFTGKVRNELTLPTTDGGNIYVVPTNPDDLSNLVGSKVYQVDTDGMPMMDTPAADGEYTLDDGRVLVVKGGEITEQRDAVDVKKLQDDLTQEKEKSSQLQAKVTELETQLNAKITEIQNAANAEVDKIRNQFEEFKKTVPGLKKDDDQTQPPKDFSKMSPAERLFNMRKESKFQ
jgi:ATP-dependent protease ClpP protease subunit